MIALENAKLNCRIEAYEDKILCLKLLYRQPFQLTIPMVNALEELLADFDPGEKLGLLIDATDCLFSMDLEGARTLVESGVLDRLLKKEAWVVNRFATRNTIRFYRLIADQRRPINVFWNKESARLWLDSTA